MSSTTGTARQIATDVSEGKRSAVDVLDAHVAYIDELEGDVHAFNHVMLESARAQASAIDARVASGESVGALAGVPVAIKDNLCTRGVPTTCSSKILDGWLPPYDATVVERLVAADAVIVGKTNLDEFAMGSSTEHSAFGPTKNPLDLSRVPGGSSGGSAAAVAANMAAVSLGSDTGGSIRQPASYCGLVGMKPTYGAVSRYGLIAFGSSLDQIGPFARTVADAALLFEAIAGHDPLDSTSIAAPAPSLEAALVGDVAGLRVGVISDFMIDAVDADVQARVRAGADALAAAGATIVDVSLPAAAHALAAYYIVAPAEASSNLARFDGVRYGLRVDGANVAAMNTATRTEGFGDEVKRRIMLGTYALSAGYYDAFYGKAQQVRTLLAEQFAAAYETCDVMLSPTAPTTAFAFGDKTDDPMAMYACDLCTIPSNLVGHPAMSVPYGVGSDGMPIGVQVLAPAQGEAPMFQVGAALERSLA